MEQQKNQLVKTESTPLKIGDQVKNEIVNGLQIRNLENPEPIKQALRRIFVLIGIRAEQVPNEDEKQLIIDFVRRNFGNYSATELVIAFEMAIMGTFKVDTEHFGQFTPKYLLNIFNAYLEHRNRVALQVQIEQEKQKRIENEEEVQVKIEAFYTEAVEFYRESVTEFKGTKYHANVLYDELKKHYTDEALIDFKQKAGAELQQMKDEYERQKRRNEPISEYLKGITFTRDEWKRRTALKVVNDALIKGIEI